MSGFPDAVVEIAGLYEQRKWPPGPGPAPGPGLSAQPRRHDTSKSISEGYTKSYRKKESRSKALRVICEVGL